MATLTWRWRVGTGGLRLRVIRGCGGEVNISLICFRFFHFTAGIELS